MKLTNVILILACLFVANGCAGAPIKLNAETLQNGESILAALANAEYPLELASTGMAQLKSGFFEESIEPNSATKTTVRLGKEQAFGDVNGDGTVDAVTTLSVDPGGSGTFTYLAVVLDERGSVKAVDSVMLGDRIVVTSLAVEHGCIVVNMLTRRMDEPMSTEPALKIVKVFQLHSDRLQGCTLGQ